jgi:soluble lytic murein transglycosylase
LRQSRDETARRAAASGIAARPGAPAPRRHAAGAALGTVAAVALSALLSALPAAAQVPQPPHAAAAAPVTAPPKRPASPAPRSTSKAEAEHRQQIDALLAPVLNRKVDTSDLDSVKQAFAAISAGDIAKAAPLREAISDPTAKKLVGWYALSRGFGSAPEYRDFLGRNPTWPQRWLLQQRLEETLFTRGGAAGDIIGYFKTTPPATAVGEAALASAHLAAGDKEKARAIAAKTWREGDLPATLETGFLERFGALLTPSDHRWRLDRYLMGDRRWNDARKTQSAYIRRMIPLLAPEERTKAEARLAVYLRSSAAEKMIAALPAESKVDWGLVFQRIQLLRRKGSNDAAVKLLLDAPTDAAKIVSPDDWWEERRALAYEALEKGNAKLAYRLIEDAGALTVNPLKEQRFMAGWVAMRYLKDIAAAEKHFRAMRAAADGPLSRAKADYWVGRVLEAKGDADEARSFYKRAAGERDTFHALLSRLKLSPGEQKLEIATPAQPTEEEARAFQALDSLAAAVIAKKAGLGADIVRPFLANSRTAMKSEAWSGLVAHFAESLGDTQMSLRIAKTALGDGHNLLIYSYPLGAFPGYEPLRDPPELAMLLGIARQETEFNTQIVSGAGARGLLQVMPVTAKHVCTDHKIKCDIPRLLTDKVYNTMIGSAYIGDRMGEFDGSYVLTLAGYNAGPGRARQWMREFGDPRSGKVDPIDWIERIPFEETREYVAKVLSNIQIYRARLGQQPALRLHRDLGLSGQ